MKASKILTGVIVLVVMVATFAFAEVETRSVKVVGIEGKAYVMIAGEGEWIPAETGMMLNEGDLVKTEKESWMLLNVDGMAQVATVEVKENSQLLLSQLLADKQAGTESTLLDLAVGEILIKAQEVRGEDSKFEVKTPTSIVGVRGTSFAVKVEAIEE